MDFLKIALLIAGLGLVFAPTKFWPPIKWALCSTAVFGAIAVVGNVYPGSLDWFSEGNRFLFLLFVPPVWLGYCLAFSGGPVTSFVARGLVGSAVGLALAILLREFSPQNPAWIDPLLVACLGGYSALFLHGDFEEWKNDNAKS